MREREEARPSGLRKIEEDDLENMDDSAPLVSQSLESLREGYSWIRHIQAEHPGWQVESVDGFPFTLPIQELSKSKVALITLGGVHLHGQKPFNTSPGVVSAELRTMRFRDRGDASFREIPVDSHPDDLRIAHAHYDHSDADEDINCVAPMTRLIELEQEGFVGEFCSTMFSMMGYVPEVDRTVQTVRKEIIPKLKLAEVDAVLVSGGCPLSHQSAAVIQREVEAAGIPTVGVTVCQDITYQLQVPRAAALRFPLGNPFGAAMDSSMQARILRDTLDLFHRLEKPGEVVALPYYWVRD